MTSVQAVLAGIHPAGDDERADLERVRAMLATGADPWTRSSALHLTGSALIFHPPSDRVLLRWHERQQTWLQVGGHADPGEADPFAVALREAREETGLADLVAWPDAAAPGPIQLAIVPVAPGKGEPAHEHADVRYILATAQPEAAVPESDSARVRWLPLEAALADVREDNLRVCLARLAALRRQVAHDEKRASTTVEG